MTNDASNRSPDQVEVKAAGAILTDPEGRLAVVWRDHHNDWSLPKGKQDPGESDEHTAIREVWEETGFRGRIVGDLGSVYYRDDRGRTKTVHYFHMVATGGQFAANDEVSAIEWLTPTEAIRRLTYDTDRQLVAAFVSPVVSD